LLVFIIQTAVRR